LSEYATALDDGTHEAEKAQRVANYIDAVQNPPAPVEPTKEELEKEAASIAEQKVQLDARLSDIAVALVDAKPKKDVVEDVIIG
jgi:hypothetical protein